MSAELKCVSHDSLGKVIVCTPPPPPILLLNFSKGGLDRFSISTQGCWERGGYHFEGVAVFT